jgi:hypothetical protein
MGPETRRRYGYLVFYTEIARNPQIIFIKKRDLTYFTPVNKICQKEVSFIDFSK